MYLGICYSWYLAYLHDNRSSLNVDLYYSPQYDQTRAYFTCSDERAPSTLQRIMDKTYTLSSLSSELYRVNILLNVIALTKSLNNRQVHRKGRL